jgi:transposase
MEADDGRPGSQGILVWGGQDGSPLRRQLHGGSEKGGTIIGYDAHKRVNGTKIHAAVTDKSLPVAIAIGPADQHEGRRLIPLLESIRTRRPRRVYADTKYDMPLNRFYLIGKRIGAQIPRRAKKVVGRPSFDEWEYKRHRSSVERFFSWLKEGFRRMGFRYERTPAAYLGFIHLACFVIHWRVIR